MNWSLSNFYQKKKYIKDMLSFLYWRQGKQGTHDVFLKHSTFYKLNLLSKAMLKLMLKCRMTRQWIGLAGQWRLSGMVVHHHGSCMVYGRQPFKSRSSWDSKCRSAVVRRAWRSSKIRIIFSVFISAEDAVCWLQWVSFVVFLTTSGIY